jgi:hypothetical protein
MSRATTDSWHESNQHYLMARLSVLRGVLTRHAARGQDFPAEEKQDEATEQALHEARLSLPAPSALDSLCAAFGLSEFECNILMLCAGLELDSDFSQACAAAQGSRQCAYPTFGLALAALPGAHWSALTPDAPLRRWRLIEVGSGETLTTNPLRIDERILHYLTGLSSLDARLHGFVELLPPPTDLPPSHRELAQRMVDFWSQSKAVLPWPVIQLCGDEHAGKRAIAAFSCHALSLQLHLLRAADIPPAVAEREALARLWEREAALSSSALLLNYDEPETSRATLSFLENVHGVLLVANREPLRL